MSAHPGRRDILRLSGAVALGSVLEACTGGHDGGPAPSAGGASSESGSVSPTAPTSTAPTSTARTSTAPTSTAPTSKAPPTVPTFATLAGQLSSGLLRPGHPGYHPGRLLYNPRFQTQKHPRAIAACRTSDDVAACVRFAADGGAPLRLRNGGHSYGGWSSGPGLVADLAPLNRVKVDPGAMTARVGAGALLIDVYAALAARGVSIGAGSCPTVGVSGLTLGGGIGVLGRAYGLTCDQVRSVHVVTADGQKRTVDAQRDPDLFWALRGGGGSVAAVTSWTFAVRPAPMISTFFFQWPWPSAATVLAGWQQWISNAPRELWSTCKLLSDPGHGGLRVTVSGTWAGSGSPNARLRALLSATPAPSTDFRSRADYGSTMLGEAGCAGQDAVTCKVGALAPAKRQPFAATSSIVAKALPHQGITAIIDAVAAGGDVPGVFESGAAFDSLGGAVADVAVNATPFPWRGALATVQHTATWNYADATRNPAPFDALVRAQRRALRPWLGSAAYLNYADPAITDFATAYWAGNAARLRQVKRAYDPHNVFAYAQSIPL